MRVGLVLEGYKILKEIGKGGNGVVFQAVSQESDTIVAIKFPLGRSISTTRAAQEFLRETEAIARLNHQNIAEHIHAGIHTFEEKNKKKLPFMIMEYVAGENAYSICGAPPPYIVRVMSQVAEAIAHAHSYRVIHRDLKPSNIMINELGSPKVLDFGLAKIQDDLSHSTPSGVFEGTHFYAAPEQYEGKADERTDVWALGAVLFELLTGRPPFIRENWGELSQAQKLFASQEMAIKQPTPKPSLFVNNIDKDLDAICIKAMEKDPRKRYQNSSEVASVLKTWSRQKRDYWIKKASKALKTSFFLPPKFEENATDKALGLLEKALECDVVDSKVRETFSHILKKQGLTNINLLEISFNKKKLVNSWSNIQDFLERLTQLDLDYLVPIRKILTGHNQESFPFQALVAYDIPKGHNVFEQDLQCSAEDAKRILKNIIKLQQIAKEHEVQIFCPQLQDIFIQPIQMLPIRWIMEETPSFTSFRAANFIHQLITGEDLEEEVKKTVSSELKHALSWACLDRNRNQPVANFLEVLHQYEKAYEFINKGVIDENFLLPPGEYHLEKVLWIKEKGHLRLKGKTKLTFGPKAGIRCLGRITAKGTWNEIESHGSISFGPHQAGGKWLGIQFLTPRSGKADLEQYFEGCYFQGATGAKQTSGEVYGGAIYVERGHLKIFGAKFEDNSVNANGGAIFFNGNSKGNRLHIQQTIFKNNEAGARGGAIYFRGTGSYLVKASTFENNSAPQGGAVYLKGGQKNPLEISLEDSHFRENQSEDCGGAIYSNLSHQIKLICCHLEKNSAGKDGGAIWSHTPATKEGSWLLHDSHFRENTAKNLGGGMYAGGTRLEIELCRVEENTASEGGGFFFEREAGSETEEAHIRKTSIVANRALEGGGLLTKYTRCTIDESRIEKNQSEEQGGGLQVIGDEVTSCKVNLTKVVCQENEARDGGAIAVSSFAKVKLRDCQVSKNQALGKGGGIFTLGPERENFLELVMVGKTLLSDNYSQKEGGAIFGGRSTLILIEKGNLTSNSSEVGGAIAVRGGQSAFITTKVTLRETILKSNSSSDSAGAIYLGIHTQMNCQSCKLINNSSQKAGAIEVFGENNSEATKIKITDTQFEKNSSLHEAGAIGAFHNVRLVVQNSLFANNIAGSSSGALHLEGQDKNNLVFASFENVQYLSNQASSDAGAIFLGHFSKGKWQKCHFKKNFAEEKNAGAILIMGKDEFFITQANFEQVVFEANACHNSGGAVNINKYSQGIFHHCKFKHNQAKTKNAGAVLVSGKDNFFPSEAKFVECEFIENTCLGSGGAVNANVHSISYFEKSYFSANNAEKNGGGICILGLEESPNKAAIRECHFVGNVAGQTSPDVALKAVKGVSNASLLEDNTVEIPAPDFYAEEMDD